MRSGSAGCGWPSTALPSASITRPSSSVAHAQPARGAHQPHAVAVPHAAQVAQRIEHASGRRGSRSPRPAAARPTGAGSRPRRRPAPGNPAAETVMPTVRATLPVSAVGMMARVVRRGRAWLSSCGFEVRSACDLSAQSQLSTSIPPRCVSIATRTAGRSCRSGSRRGSRRGVICRIGDHLGAAQARQLLDQHLDLRPQRLVVGRVAGGCRSCELPAASSRASRTSVSVISGWRLSSRRTSRAAMAAATWTALASQCVSHACLACWISCDRLPQGGQRGGQLLLRPSAPTACMAAWRPSRSACCADRPRPPRWALATIFAASARTLSRYRFGLRGHVVEVERHAVRAAVAVGGSDDGGHGQ